MKKHLQYLFIFTLAFVLLFVLTGCRTRTPYEYIDDPSEIVAVEIVEFDASEPYPQWTVLYTIDDIDAFLKKFDQLPCYNKFSHPLGILHGDKVFKITYADGDYELTGENGIAWYQSEHGFSNYQGWTYFLSEDFQALLDEYLQL